MLGMPYELEKASGLGFCFGVRRAISTVERVAQERGGVETLGALVHNPQVMERMAALNVRVVSRLEDVKGKTIVISSHGVGPAIIERIGVMGLEIVDTTCPFVKRAQVAARRLSESGFYTIIYGDVNHPEVRGILGWAGDNGLAMLDIEKLKAIVDLPRHLGVLSQTTQIPAHFIEFAKTALEKAMVKDAEVRVVDTICHDIRDRQASTLELASRSDLMLVIGGRQSANTRHLVGLCQPLAETFLVETAAEIASTWLAGKKHVGITAGASTSDDAIAEVWQRLNQLNT